MWVGGGVWVGVMWGVTWGVREEECEGRGRAPRDGVVPVEWTAA